MLQKNTEAVPPQILTPNEIAAWSAYAEPPAAGMEKSRLQQRLKDTDQWCRGQIAGRRWSIGCVSLEITQRCNLDCTLCYLSDHSEATKDLPLTEVFRRIDLIRAHYGANTDVQISGGDPTLRRRDELVAIVRRLRERELRPSLFTNGILATRALLAELSEAGLVDVAFHVDLTQERKGYRTEIELNDVRREYIERVRGLPLSVFFNTTVYAENFHEIPALVNFFRDQSDVVRLVSFQLQADTGRGVLRERHDIITPDSVIAQINDAAGTDLRFDSLSAGHSACNRYTMALVVNRRFIACYDNPELTAALMKATADLEFDRTKPQAAIKAAVLGFLRTPQCWLPGMRWLGRKLWSARQDLWRARGRVTKLSFFVHNFMDGCRLEHDRVHACTFMVATSEGPMSMCLHNAKRDDYILSPVAIEGEQGVEYWDPLTGTTCSQSQASVQYFPLKLLRGRRRRPHLQRTG